MTKWHLTWLLVFVVGVLAVLYLPRCNSGAAQDIITATFDSDHAWKDLTTQVADGYRIPGTASHRKVRDWLVKELSTSAEVVTTQPFSHQFNGNATPMWNIIATFSGTGKAPRERVLLAAHWDSRPTADKDPDPANRKLPIAGANDGASGVAVLLEIARQLKLHPIQRDVVIVLFDGEDYGPGIEEMLLGSQYYAAHLPTEKPTWGILLDMIGDKDLSIYREQYSDQYASTVNDRIFRASRELGYQGSATTSGFIDKPYKYAIEDDHMALNKAGVPMVDLIDFDYADWHTRGDTVDKCSPDSLNIVGRTVLYAIQLP